MSSTSHVPASPSPVRAELSRVWAFLKSELRPRGKVVTPFNVVTAAIVLATAVILFFRFAYGIGSVTNLNQQYPWGLWIGFDVVTGVAFAGGAYVMVFLVHVLGMERYRPIVRVTVLNGFLAYVFYAGALVLDLGRPWNVINPVIGNSFGVSSVLFLVAWHFMLYMFAQLIEFSPAIAEWLGLERVREHEQADAPWAHRLLAVEHAPDELTRRGGGGREGDAEDGAGAAGLVRTSSQGVKSPVCLYRHL